MCFAPKACMMLTCAGTFAHCGVRCYRCRSFGIRLIPLMPRKWQYIQILVDMQAKIF